MNDRFRMFPTLVGGLACLVRTPSPVARSHACLLDCTCNNSCDQNGLLHCVCKLMAETAALHLSVEFDLPSTRMTAAYVLPHGQSQATLQVFKWAYMCAGRAVPSRKHHHRQRQAGCEELH